MLAKLFEIFGRSTAPSHPDIKEILSLADLRPAEGFSLTVSENCIPGLVARRLASLFSGNRHVGGFLTDAIDVQKREEKEIFMRDVEGCLCSRTQLNSFKAMESNSHVKMFYETYHADPSKIVDQVFAGSSDCIAQAGEKPKIYRQPWDGKMWYVNAGGSHRATAIRMIDADHNFQRSFLSDIEDFEFSPKFEMLCKQASIFIFEAENDNALDENIRQLAEKEIFLEPEKYNGDGWCLVISKNHPQYADVKRAMAGCLDFAAWAENPNGYKISPPVPVIAGPEKALA